MRGWREEFDLSYDCPDLPEGWIDVSWHNESCPAYQAGELMVWCDHPNPAERDKDLCTSGNNTRYVVTNSEQVDGFGDGWSPIVLETDDWQAVLSFVASHPDGR